MKEGIPKTAIRPGIPSVFIMYAIKKGAHLSRSLIFQLFYFSYSTLAILLQLFYFGCFPLILSKTFLRGL